MRSCVGKNKYAMVSSDRSRLSSRVSRQARMARRIDIARAYALTGAEGGLDVHVAPGGAAARDHGRNLIRSQAWIGFGITAVRVADFHLSSGDRSAKNCVIHQAHEPFLVIGHAKILRRRQLLQGVARRIQIEFAAEAKRER